MRLNAKDRIGPGGQATKWVRVKLDGVDITDTGLVIEACEENGWVRVCDPLIDDAGERHIVSADPEHPESGVRDRLRYGKVELCIDPKAPLKFRKWWGRNH